MSSAACLCGAGAEASVVADPGATATAGPVAPAAAGHVAVRAANSSGVPWPLPMKPEEAAVPLAPAAAGPLGKPLRDTTLPSLPVPPAVVSAELLDADASFSPRFPSSLAKSHPWYRASPEEAYAAFKTLMVAIGHRVPVMNHFTRFLCE